MISDHFEVAQEKSHWSQFLSSRLDEDALDRMKATVLADTRIAPASAGLEIGCGEGRLVARIPGIIGIDYAMLGLRHRVQPELPLACADASRLPFRDNSFGFAVTNCLHHMPYCKTASELMRVLHPGGVLHLFEPNRAHIYNLLFNTAGGNIIAGDRGFFPDKLAQTLRLAGFGEITWDYIILNMERIRLIALIQRFAQHIPTRLTQAWFHLRAVKS
jgi:SAM-dependent methyltransferase